MFSNHNYRIMDLTNDWLFSVQESSRQWELCRIDYEMQYLSYTKVRSSETERTILDKLGLSNVFHSPEFRVMSIDSIRRL